MSPAVYLHWNGGPESVYAFLEELDRRGVRADQNYECARFVQVVGEFFTWSTEGDLSDPIYREGAFGLSLGIANGPRSDSLEDLECVQTDHGDNGFYLVCRVAGREDAGTLVDTGWVRRFTEAYYPETGLTEWAPEAVERERDTAAADASRAAFREFFAGLEERAQVGEKVPA
jgi:hypothetical protein